MATITVNLATPANAQATTIKGGAIGPLQVAEVFVSPSGTYDTGAAPSIDLTNVATAIQISRRNGKTVTLVNACPGQAAFEVTNSKHWALTVATVAGADVECEIHEVGAAEYANGVALPAWSYPMSVIVAFTEA
jgi:hypothetical protein